MNKLIPLLAFSILLLVPVGIQTSFAFDVGPSPVTTTTPTVDGPFDEEIISPIATGWDLPLRTINHDPNAGQWLKLLLEDVTSTQYPKTLIETIVVDPNSEPFSDWHEKLDASPTAQPFCYIWSSSVVFFAQNLPPGTTPSATFSPDRKIVDWTFDPPIPPGHEFKLFKFIDCDLAVGQQSGIIEVLQYPTVPAPDNQAIGGEIIPIDATSLLLSSTQTFSWMIPVVLSVLGIGLFVVSRKNE